MQISVIVPVFNDWRRVAGLLEALAAQEFPSDDFEVLLVDNGSTSIPELHNAPRSVTVLHCSTPGSYAARNAGIRAAKADILAFTDADCLPSPQWLKHAYRQLKSNNRSDAVIAGGVTLFLPDPSRPTTYALYDLALGITQERYVRRGYGVTANLFVPKTVFDQVGLFDSKRLSGGDAEFCRRAGSHGIPTLYLGAAEVLHPTRCEWHELAGKVRRVKGGQLLNGPILRRVLYGVRTLLPPVKDCICVVKSDRLAFQQKIPVCIVRLRLWGVELTEVWRLLVLKKLPTR